MMHIKEEVIADESIDEKDQYLQVLNDDRTNGDASNSHLFGKKSEMEGIREVQQLLKKWQLQDLCNGFSDHRIDTFALERLIESDIRDLIPCVGLRVKFRFALQEYILNIGKFACINEQESSRKSSSSEEEVQLVLDEHPSEIIESDSEIVNEVPAKIPRLSSPTGDNYSDFSANREKADASYFVTIKPEIRSPELVLSSPEPSTSHKSHAPEIPISTTDPPAMPPPPPLIPRRTTLVTNMLQPVLNNPNVNRKDVEHAVVAVLNKELGQKKAAQQFSVSLVTLKRNLASQSFTVKEEAFLAEQFKNQPGLTCRLMREQAYQYASQLPHCKYPEGWDRRKVAGHTWFNGFVRRHPELKVGRRGKPIRNQRKRKGNRKLF